MWTPSGGDAISGRIPLMGNHDVVLYIARPTETMSYWYKFAHGDDVLFIHEGTGALESQFGLLRYRPGDYLVIPTGVIWRLLPDPDVPQRMLVVESYPPASSGSPSTRPTTSTPSASPMQTWNQIRHRDINHAGRRNSKHRNHKTIEQV